MTLIDEQIQPHLDASIVQRSGHRPSSAGSSIRLDDGEVVQLGTAPNRDSALVLARTVIAEIEDPGGEWPLVGDRMLRPESIVSVDILTIS